MAQLQAKITLSAIDKASATLRKVHVTLRYLRMQTLDVRRAMEKFNSATKEVGTKLGKVSLAVTGAATGLFAMAKQASNATWEIETNARILGMSAEQYQRWSYAITNYTNVSEGGFKRVAMRLNKLVVEAAKDPTSDIAKGFRHIGIQVKDSEGKIRKFQDVMLDIADVSKKIKSEPRKMAFLQSYLGRFGVELAPLLANGKKMMGKEGYGVGLQDILGEADDYGIYSKKDIQQSKAAGNAIWEVEMKMKKLWKTVAIAVTPAITQLAEKLSTYMVANDGLIKQNISGFFAGLVAAIKGFIRVLDILKTILTPIVTLFGGLENIIKILAGVYFLKIAASVLVLSKAFWALNVALLANPIIFIGTAIALAITAVVKLLDHFGVLDSMGKRLKETFSFFADLKNLFSKGIFNSITELDEQAQFVRFQRANPAFASAVSGGAIPPLSFSGNSPENPTLPRFQPAPLAPADNTPKKLEISMKIDAEGRPKDVKALSRDPIRFTANTGVLMP
jgi:hypothetical protein